MLLASVQNLADRLGQPLTEGTPDYTRAESNLEDASALVMAASRVYDPGDDIPDLVKVVTLQAAKRAFLNPTGTTQRTMGPFTEGFSAQAASGVYLTEDEERLLSQVAETTGGLVSVPTRRLHEHSWCGYEYAYDQNFPSSPAFPYFAEEDEGIWGRC